MGQHLKSSQSKAVFQKPGKSSARGPRYEVAGKEPKGPQQVLRMPLLCVHHKLSTRAHKSTNETNHSSLWLLNYSQLSGPEYQDGFLDLGPKAPYWLHFQLLS